MNINASNNYNYSPLFGTSMREYKNPVPNLMTGEHIYTTTCMFRTDFPLDEVMDLAIEKFKNKPKVNIHCLACSDGSEAYSIVMGLMKKLPSKEFNKYLKIQASDRDAEIINFAKTGKINLSEHDINKCKEYIGKDCFVKNTTYHKIPNDVMLTSDMRTYEPISDLKNSIEFKQGNLLDVIKDIKDDGNTWLNCRNVMPYLHPAYIGDIAYWADKNLKKGSIFVIGDFDRKNTQITNYLDFYNFKKAMENVYVHL